MPALSGILNSYSAPPNPEVSFEDKNVIVTGGNTGIGLEAAIKFVNSGAAKVIITTRDLEKGRHAKAQISQRTNKGDSVEVWQLDMNSYSSIQAFCDKASSKLDHLDIVVLNAAIAPRHFAKSPTGWESAIQINLLSTVLLALMLLPKLRSSKTPGSNPRLEVVAARAHESVKLSPEQRNSANILESFSVDKTEDFKALRQYTSSKLLLMFAVQELAEMAMGKNGDPDVIVAAVCPGACASDLSRDYDGVFKIIKGVAAALILKTTEEGARTYIIGVSKGKESHGRFIQNSEIRP
jgi:NAD(P)-dependent dehydrogenase (short-subunit alcohol dehydrogenase family)